MLTKAESPVKSALVKSAAAFRTISEVSDDLTVPQHVLRFWETKFPQIRPLKRGGGRRYYRPEDVELLRRIQSLLYQEGYTIKGVQRLLKESRGALPLPSAPLPSNGEGSEVEPATPDLFAAEEPEDDEPVLPERESSAPEPVDSAPAAAELPEAVRREIEVVLGELRDLRAFLAVRRR